MSLASTEHDETESESDDSNEATRDAHRDKPVRSGS
jgi:hypothetical protein